VNVALTVNINVVKVSGTDVRVPAALSDVALAEVHRILSTTPQISGSDRDVIDGCVLSYMNVTVVT